MRKRLFLFGTLAAAAIVLGGVLPAAAQLDDAPVLQYDRLVATANLRLTEDGRSSVDALIGKVVTVDTAGNVLSERPYQGQTAGFRAMGSDLPQFPCVYDSNRNGFTAFPPTQLPVDEKNEKGLFRFFPYSVDRARRVYAIGPQDLRGPRECSRLVASPRSCQQYC